MNIAAISGQTVSIRDGERRKIDSHSTGIRVSVAKSFMRARTGHCLRLSAMTVGAVDVDPHAPFANHCASEDLQGKYASLAQSDRISTHRHKRRLSEPGRWAHRLGCHASFRKGRGIANLVPGSSCALSQFRLHFSPIAGSAPLTPPVLDHRTRCFVPVATMLSQ